MDQHGAIWGDIDNDGDDDLYLSVSSSNDQLLINDGGRLTDRSASWEVDRFGHDASRMSVFLDYTGDGKLDIMAIRAYQARGSIRSRITALLAISLGERVNLDCNDDGSFAHLVDVDVYPRPRAALRPPQRCLSRERICIFIGRGQRCYELRAADQSRQRCDFIRLQRRSAA